MVLISVNTRKLTYKINRGSGKMAAVLGGCYRNFLGVLAEYVPPKRPLDR
jgi:hypothetical protein